MKLQFVRPFGHHGVGDFIELPDGEEVVYDTAYLAPADAEDGGPKDAEADKKPDGKPLYPRKKDA